MRDVNFLGVQLFYGPPEPTWILPTRDETPPRRYKEHEYYKVREVIEPQRRSYYPSPPRPAGRPVQHRPVIDRNIRPVVPAGPAPLTVDRDIRPVVRDERSHPVEQEIRPIERLARVHTVPEQVPIRAPQEEIRKVVEVPVPVPVPVHVPAPPEVVHVQHRDVAPPPQVVKRSISPPIPRPPVHHVSLSLLKTWVSNFKLTPNTRFKNKFLRDSFVKRVQSWWLRFSDITDLFSNPLLLNLDKLLTHGIW